MPGSALLAIWSDVAPDSETDYLHWLTREHTEERVTTDGFVSVRVFRAELPEVRRYLIVYDLNGPDALQSADYLAKLNNPTPWSRRIMPTLKNFVRGGGRIVASAGTGRGGIAAAIIFDDIPQDIHSIVENLAKEDRICSVQAVQTDQSKTGLVTREKEMRKGDRSFAGLLIIDGLDAEAVIKGCARLNPIAPSSKNLTLYRQVFSLERRAAGGAEPKMVSGHTN